MSLDRKTIAAILLSVLTKPCEIASILACIDTEEKFRERLAELNETMERLAGMKPIRRDLIDACESQIMQHIKQCQHWIVTFDHVCRVCGEPL